MSIGFHINKSAGGKKRLMATAISEAIELLRSFGFKQLCGQIFVSGPQSYKEILTDEDKEQCRRLLLETGFSVVIHGSYVDHPWNRAQGSVHNIKQELRIAARIGATGVIVHLGAGAFDDDNLKYVLEEVSNLPNDIKDKVTFWLEIHTAQPSPRTYETPAKLQRLFERVAAVDTRGLKVGLCIDTAHLFSCGMSLDTDVAAERWLAGLPNVPVMLHLNDSASKLASGIDAHQTLCEGGIWSAYHPANGHLPMEDSGLVTILNWVEKNNVMVILERNEEGTLRDLTLIQQLGYFQD